MGAFLTHEDRNSGHLARIEKRLAFLTMLPPENGEAIQILRYASSCTLPLPSLFAVPASDMERLSSHSNVHEHGFCLYRNRFHSEFFGSKYRRLQELA